jgi:hypothetical protein
MDNATYLRVFQNHIEAIDHLDGDFGVDNALIVTRMIDNNEDPDDKSAWITIKEAVTEEVVAKYFLMKSDPKRYASLLASIQNDYVSGSDRYPKTLTKSYDMVVNYVNPHKHGGIDAQDLGMSFYQDNDYPQARGRNARGGRGRGREGHGRDSGRGDGRRGGIQDCGGQYARGGRQQQSDDDDEDDHNYELEEEEEEIGGAEVALFAEKQKYFYAILERTLQTDKGKAIVCAHEATFDAQTVYKEMYEYCNRSTRAMLNSSTLLSYITSARLGDGSWKSGTHKFILHWEEQIRQYEKLVSPTNHFSEAIQLHMLQNAVNPVPEVRQVKVQADQLMTQTGKALTYSEYVGLVYSASAQYDNQFATSSGAKLAQKRQVYNHQLDTIDDDYDVDKPVSVIQANQATRREAMMPGGVWAKLSEAEREIWDKLSDNTK